MKFERIISCSSTDAVWNSRRHYTHDIRPPPQQPTKSDKDQDLGKQSGWITGTTAPRFLWTATKDAAKVHWDSGQQWAKNQGLFAFHDTLMRHVIHNGPVWTMRDRLAPSHPSTQPKLSTSCTSTPKTCNVSWEIASRPSRATPSACDGWKRYTWPRASNVN